MKLLYLVKRPLSPRDAERFGIAHALAAGHHVRVFDITRPSHPTLPADPGPVWRHPGLMLESFADWAALRARRAAFAEADLILALNQSFGLSRNTLPPLRLIAASRTPYLLLAPSLYGSAAPMLRELPAGRRLTQAWSRLRLADPVNSLIARLPPGWLGIPPARFIVYNGLASIKPNSLVGRATQPIPAHTADYDQALGLIAAGQAQSADVAVFLDQFVPFHSDLTQIKSNLRVEPAPYYAALRGLFDRIERELGLRVVIAAHPRADYHRRPGLFGDREVVQGKSVEMIARSRLVLAHISTVTGLATVFNKPVMVITTRPQYAFHPNHTQAYDDLSRALGTRLHFIDDPATVDLADALTIDQTAYTAYRDRYLRHPEAPAGRLWEIVFAQVAAALSARPERP